MEHNKTLSIVTPAYNREKLLTVCYKSLLQQTNYDFEWIIIDDGSTDNTEEAVKTFAESPFPIVYEKKENGGKHTALNASHKHINGQYVLILDSDDTLVPEAVETIIQGWNIYSEQENIGIVIFLKGESSDKPNAYAKDENTPVDIMRYKRICIKSNDCCEVIRTELFKKYPFPVFKGERFISEGALWNRVSFTHKCVYINKVLYLCEYLDGGLTKSGKKLRISNPLGGMYTSNLNMSKKNFFSRRIKNGLLYTCYGCFSKKGFMYMWRNSDSKLLMTMELPFGWLMYHYWKRKYK